MPHKITNSKNLQRETLRKIVKNEKLDAKVRQLAQLRIDYSEDSKNLTSYINQLVGKKRVYMHHLPTQASGRWSTFDPPITNWPRACINPTCPKGEHEWEDGCWSIRDILTADDDEVLITWDHDNIEGKIHDLIVENEEKIKAHAEGYDLHTITCCKMFKYELPINLKNPHSSEEDRAWRARYNWQGKDTKVRVLAKNFNHGSKYTESYMFVHKITGIEKYGISYKELEELARQYIVSEGNAWERKCAIMERIRRERIARSLYGFRRVFFDASPETGREGFSHMISATVSDYNNMTLQLLRKKYGKLGVLLHNAHDGNKFVIKKVYVNFHYGNDVTAFKKDLASVIEREIRYKNRALTMTAGVKIYA